MKRSGWFIGIVIGIVLASNLYGGGYSSQTEPFTDGIRDKLLWRQEAATFAHFLETGGHLYFDSLSPEPPLVRQARWFWKSTYLLISGDVLEVESLVSMPIVTGLPADAAYSVGIGLKDGDSAGVLYFTVDQRASGRSLLVETIQEGGTPIITSDPVPTSARKFYIKIRYANSTGKASFWVRDVSATSWTKIGSAINLRNRWGIVGFTLSAQPLVMGQTDQVWVKSSDNVFLDNFRVTCLFNSL